MFESVEQLEKDIEIFHKNILASSELIKGIENLIVATKLQKGDFAANSSELVLKMNSHAAVLQANYEEALAKLIKENNSVIESLSVKGDDLLKKMKTIPPDVEKRNSTLSHEFHKCTDEFSNHANAIVAQLRAEKEALFTKCDELLNAISSDNKVLLADVAETINTTQQKYIQRIEAAEVTIKKCEAEINRKYDEFLTKLESTNVDQIFKMSQDIKKTMDAKFMLLTIGVGASLVLMIASFFIR